MSLALLLDRVTYYVPALDPALAVNREPRTLEQMVHDYGADDEPRTIAPIGGWHDLPDEPRANAVASHCRNDKGLPSHLHRPVLDVDGDVTGWTRLVIRTHLEGWCEVDVPDDALTVVPSSTLGHHHVYVSTMVPEVGYMHALMALAVAEVIEPNYALVSIRRRASFLRLPGITKPDRPVFHEEEVPW